ncbi:MAG: CDP-diacylglycerol--glycerol-3-phosphate 3-phosphatidyltransferase [Mariprofundaceae bacterium]|nr:CDP-diacylglycerol--glycerol-3-phosphate 3-phosphatidyltransferase [Mariprofundaceae bacterium]
MQWTLSNQLTIGRVLLIPLFMIAFYLPGFLGYILAAAIFALASATDWLDGHLARTRGEVTAFGRFLDPVADKLLVAAALVVLVEAERVPALLAVIIIGREIAISALREWLAEHAATVHVSMLGKMKTAAQMISIIALLLHIDMGGINMHSVGLLLLWIAAILTLWSGYEYIRDAWPELMGRRKPTNDVEQSRQSPDQ